MKSDMMKSEHPFDEAMIAAGKAFLQTAREDIAASLEWRRMQEEYTGTSAEAELGRKAKKTGKRFKEAAATLKKHRDAYRGSSEEWAVNWDKHVEIPSRRTK